MSVRRYGEKEARYTRAFLRAVLFALVLLLVACGKSDGSADDPASPSVDGPGAGRPNVILVLADDLDKSVFGRSTLDDPWAAEGTSFSNALVTTSVCCPSRASILRGQYAHNTGLVSNDSSFVGDGGKVGGGAAYFRRSRLDRATIATAMRSGGYETWYGGKHLNGYGEDGGAEGYEPPGWDSWQAYLSWSTANVDGRKVEFEQHYTDWLSARAQTFIESRRDPERPFFMMIAPFDTHESPLEIPPRHRGAYRGQKAPRPPSFDEADVSDKERWVAGERRVGVRRAATYDRLHVKRMQSALTLEDLSRSVLGALRRTGELDQTYLIFTSDNGFHLGLHRVPFYKWTPYMEAHEVPFVVRGPGVPAGASRDELVANIDLAPTIADLGGVEAPAYADGRSLKPLLKKEPPSGWRSALLIEGIALADRPAYSGVRRSEEVYVEYEGGEQEYYDLEADPYQLVSRPQAAPQTIKDELSLLEDCARSGCRIAEGP